ncbi:hypothetical protein EVAR_64183_1 [Eumeta japonica]|uniref:Uncharacterized protein n=1 Tax=Eumeta variegata TaxID=151549 RepID=A0A4C1ZJH4_EUMVA|nr:hypothetical protein EVAR_64183_1 [Eumeta japonica]
MSEQREEARDSCLWSFRTDDPRDRGGRGGRGRARAPDPERAKFCGRGTLWTRYRYSNRALDFDPKPGLVPITVSIPFLALPWRCVGRGDCDYNSMVSVSGSANVGLTLA